MSILDNIGSGFKSLGNVAVEGIKSSLNPGSLIQAGASLVGGILGNRSRADQATAANEFSANQFATRYQTTVKDMQAAGLNPMLAYSQGASGQPSGQQAVMQDYISPAVSAYQNSNQDLKDAAQAELNAATAAQARKNIELINETVTKTKQEVENLKTDKDRNDAVIKNLGQQFLNLQDEGKNLKTQNDVLRKSVEKMIAEIPSITKETLLIDVNQKLANLEYDAAKKTSNIGREFKQIQPMLELLKDVLSVMRPRGSIVINRGK